MSSAESHRVIAVEEHFSTDAFLDRIAKMNVVPGEEEEREIIADFSEKLRSLFVDDGIRLATMNAAGIDMSVLSFNPPGVQACVDADDATALAREANDVLAQIVSAHPDRLAALGAVAPQDPEQAADEIKRAMRSLNFGGVMICSHTHGRYLDDPACGPILAALEEEDATLYLHPRCPSPGMMAPYTQYGMIGAVWGFQAEAGTHAIRLILSGVFDRHPGLRVVLGHLGEGIPYWLDRLDNRVEATRRAGGDQLGMKTLQLKPSEYFRRNFWMTTSGMSSNPPFDYCLEHLGAGKVLFAVDAPYEDSNEAARFLREAKLDEAQRALVSHGNAERLFRIAPSR